MAVVVVLAAVAVRLVFLSALGTRAPFVTFYPAVLLVALFGGWRAGVLATVLSAGLADYFWLPPKRLLDIGDPGDWLAMAVFALSAATIILVAEGMRRAEARARDAEMETRVAMVRQRDLEALRLSEERFVKAFQDNTAAMTITRLRDGMFIDVNDRWVEMNGFPRAEVLGQRSSHLDIWKDAESRDEFVRELAQRGTLHNRELHFIRKDGEEWTGLVSSQVSEIAGEPAIISSIIDISERTRAEAALREANLQLAQADRRKSEFLAVLSHELRNPLAPIRNSIYLLGRVAPGGDQARRALAIIDRQTTQMVRLVDDLLDITRITRNKIRLQRERLDLGELVGQTIEDERSLFHARDVHLDHHAAPGKVWMDGDRSRLAQVVGNLLQNAAKFTGQGGSVTVSLSVEPDGQQAVLRVADTGVGLTPEMLGRLFVPFAQADTSLDRNQGGLGLGLALVKGLVELHGGQVSAASAGIGKGAEFIVRLPLASEPAATREASTAQRSGDIPGFGARDSGTGAA
jgi:PAS domain S-box-containing protein